MCIGLCQNGISLMVLFLYHHIEYLNNHAMEVKNDLNSSIVWMPIIGRYCFSFSYYCYYNFIFLAFGMACWILLKVSCIRLMLAKTILQ